MEDVRTLSSVWSDWQRQQQSSTVINKGSSLQCFLGKHTQRYTLGRTLYLTHSYEIITTSTNDLALL